jgi:glycosyltransferase involved in cell wall biosynthesis
MKVAYITAGAAGMYCGSCLHDNTLARAMIRKGHDVALIPLYTPIRTDEEDVSIDRVFYGAINVYLEQKSALFRHTPWLVDRMLNGRGLLNWAARRGAASSQAKELGELTLSVLQGEEGKQRKELDRLVEWLRDSYRPDIVHLSNSMMSGLARRIHLELGVPVVSSVQGEDLFLEQLVEPHLDRVMEQLRKRAGDVAGFIATSRYYADYMREFLHVGADRMHQVNLGVSLDGYDGREDEDGERPFVVGYLARICPEKGLHLLVEGFKRLLDATGRERVRLEIAGYLGEGDRDYFDGIMKQVAAWGIDDSVRHRGEIDRAGKIGFLQSLDVLSVPTTYREPKGLFVLESLAAGVPVVQPGHGAFPELLEATGGGLLFEPGSADALAAALREILENPERRRELGRRGREAVRKGYDDGTMAENTAEVYRRYVDLPAES